MYFFVDVDTIRVWCFQVLFKPLLKNIGLHIGEVKTSALMKKLGCDVSIKLHMTSLRVDIVDSEHKKRHRGRGKGKRMSHIYIRTNLDTPAFLCDNLEALVSMRDVINFEQDEKPAERRLPTAESAATTDDKQVFESLIAKPTTTKVNFLLNVVSLNQHVNMPLLRLTYQLSTMIDNVTETRSELKGLTSTDAFRGHRKQDSKGSWSDTAGDAASAGQPEFPVIKAESLSPNVDRSPLHSTSMPVARPTLQRRDTPVPRPNKLPLSGNSAPGLANRGAVSQPVNIPTPQRLEVAGRSRAAGRSPTLGRSRISGRSPTAGRSPVAARRSPAAGRSPITGRSPATGPPSSSPTSATDSLLIDMESPAVDVTAAPAQLSDELKAVTPQCWKTLYALLHLYSIMPEPKTVNKPTPSRLSIIDEELGDLSQQSQGLAQRESFKMKKLNKVRQRVSLCLCYQSSPCLHSFVMKLVFLSPVGYERGAGTPAADRRRADAGDAVVGA